MGSVDHCLWLSSWASPVASWEAGSQDEVSKHACPLCVGFCLPAHPTSPWPLVKDTLGQHRGRSHHFPEERRWLPSLREVWHNHWEGMCLSHLRSWHSGTSCEGRDSHRHRVANGICPSFPLPLTRVVQRWPAGPFVAVVCESICSLVSKCPWERARVYVWYMCYIDEIIMWGSGKERTDTGTSVYQADSPWLNPEELSSPLSRNLQ